jgi:hypothetical protein
LIELETKKRILQFIKLYPKEIKACFTFNNKLFFVIDNKEIAQKINEIFKEARILILEDLIENLYEGNQLFIRIIEDAEIIFDNGIIKSLQSLIKKGKIRPSKHAIYHSFIKALKQKDLIYEKGKEMVANMFWSLYYLLQSYFMFKDKYITPNELIEILKLSSEKGEFDKKVYLLYEALYSLYFNLHKYNLEELDYLLRTYENVFEEVKEKFEKEFKYD